MTTFEERLKEALSDAYEIERELGGGGMSRVFVATDRSLGRKVVIKLLSPELTAEVNRGRFRREIQVAAQLQHPHIVTLFSAGEDGELVYYTMPFIEGESLKSAIEKHGPLSVRDTVRVLYDVVDALSYAHARGVVHRDIKPANILRSGSHSLVTDFGVAKALNAAMPSTAMTSTGMAIGTPAYMAPEQLAGDPSADHRIDIYAVGLLAYELLTGKSPFASSSPQGVLAAVLTRDPPPLSDVRQEVPRRLSELIMACLSKLPGGRPPTAEALLVALDMFSTASGEIRTREYKVPETPVAVPVAVLGPSGGSPDPTGGAAVAASSVAAAATGASGAMAAATGPTNVSSGTAPAVLTAPPPSRSRSKLLVAGLVLLPLAAAGALLASKRGGQKNPAVATEATTVRGQSSQASASENGSVTAGAPVVPVTIAPIDSVAIAEAVRKRVADAVAAEGPSKATETPISADSLRRRIQREMADSMARANRARAAAVAAATPPVVPTATPAPAPAAAPAPAPAPAPVAAASDPSGPRRLAITEPREINQPVLSRFSRQLTDALRGAVDDGFAPIDQDSVRSAITGTRSRDEAAKVLRPDVMVSPNYVGTGDTVNIVVTVWDLRSNSSFGIRVTSTRLVPSNPEHYLGPVVQAVLKQLADLSRAPTIYRR